MWELNKIISICNYILFNIIIKQMIITLYGYCEYKKDKLFIFI